MQFKKNQLAIALLPSSDTEPAPQRDKDMRKKQINYINNYGKR